MRGVGCGRYRRQLLLFLLACPYLCIRINKSLIGYSSYYGSCVMITPVGWLSFFIKESEWGLE